MADLAPGLRQRLNLVWGLLRGKVDTRGLSGSETPLGASTLANEFYQGLEITQKPLRPVAGTLETSYNLCEVAQWCYEARHGVLAIARDAFMEPEGRVGSWRIGPSQEMEESGVELDPDIVAIARDLSNRTYGKIPVLGGNRLQRAAREFLFYGDSFLEIAIEREGIGRMDWGISRTQYLPPLQMFVNKTAQGDLEGYTQRARIHKSPDDVDFHPIKVLQFSYQADSRYGSPMTLPSLPYWDKVKKVAKDLEQAARTVSINPWLHVAPPNWSPDQLKAYEQEYRQKTARGIITNLFLLNGMDVKRAAGSVPSLEPLLNTWLEWRYLMVPAGVPLWYYPGLGLKESSGREIANQPALVYARLIADVRATLSEQIKFAVMLEAILRKGLDWYLADPTRYEFDIVWPRWTVTALDSAIQTAADVRQEESGADVAQGLIKQGEAAGLQQVEGAIALSLGTASQQRDLRLLRDRLAERELIMVSNGNGRH